MDQKLLMFINDQTQIKAAQIMATLELLIKEQCTIPFITRYRKEKTGGLDEVQIQAIQENYELYTETEKRRDYILTTIEKADQMTPALKAQILGAKTLQILEDIYAPFKSKRKTKAMVAKEAGLEPLALEILKTTKPKDEITSLVKEKFLNPEMKIATYEDAMSGASDILMEMFSNDVEIKNYLREQYWSSAKLTSEKRKDAETVKDWEKYKDYFEFSQEIKNFKEGKNTHRFMAIRRGFMEKVLKISIEFDEQIAVSAICREYFDNTKLSFYDFLTDCAARAHRVYIHSSLDLEIKSELKIKSDEEAINVFGVNLKNLLLQPYLGAKAVIGIDPGVRTGCKVVVISETGKLLFDTVIYPHPPKNDQEHSANVLMLLAEKFNVTHIAIGNGTYGRETLAFVNSFVKKKVAKGKIEASMISEAGASIYSTSEVARNEFPDKDPTVRGAVSIARRFQDPLAELVKIDPKSIGVGQYQHDVNQVRLKKSLDSVVESCVNYVGVDLNTASAALLSFVSGIGPKVAENIITHRQKVGSFNDRSELLKVSRFSEKVFEQAAGFLRIYNGEQVLDGTFIHPESYKIIENWTKAKGHSLKELITTAELIEHMNGDRELKEKLGEFTHKDIITSLKAPSQDPRTTFEGVDFRDDISEISDLKIGDWYTGVVTNITQFGAFVDVGIKENGLLHVSQITERFIDNALEVLKVGEKLKVRVLDIDFDRKRISLSCKQEGANEVRQASGQSSNRPSQGSRGQNSSRNHPQKPHQPEKLKNNAFAALKNFKV